MPFFKSQDQEEAAKLFLGFLLDLEQMQIEQAQDQMVAGVQTVKDIGDRLSSGRTGRQPKKYSRKYEEIANKYRVLFGRPVKELPPEPKSMFSHLVDVGKKVAEAGREKFGEYAPQPLQTGVGLVGGVVVRIVDAASTAVGVGVNTAKEAGTTVLEVSCALPQQFVAFSQSIVTGVVNIPNVAVIGVDAVTDWYHSAERYCFQTLLEIQLAYLYVLEAELKKNHGTHPKVKEFLGINDKGEEVLSPLTDYIKMSSEIAINQHQNQESFLKLLSTLHRHVIRLCEEYAENDSLINSETQERFSTSLNQSQPITDFLNKFNGFISLLLVATQEKKVEKQITSDLNKNHSEFKSAMIKVVKQFQSFNRTNVVNTKTEITTKLDLISEQISKIASLEDDQILTAIEQLQSIRNRIAILIAPVSDFQGEMKKMAEECVEGILEVAVDKPGIEECAGVGIAKPQQKQFLAEDKKEQVVQHLLEMPGFQLFKKNFNDAQNTMADIKKQDDQCNLYIEVLEQEQRSRKAIKIGRLKPIVEDYLAGSEQKTFYQQLKENNLYGPFITELTGRAVSNGITVENKTQKTVEFDALYQETQFKYQLHLSKPILPDCKVKIEDKVLKKELADKLLTLNSYMQDEFSRFLLESGCTLEKSVDGGVTVISLNDQFKIENNLEILAEIDAMQKRFVFLQKVLVESYACLERWRKENPAKFKAANVSADENQDLFSRKIAMVKKTIAVTMIPILDVETKIGSIAELGQIENWGAEDHIESNQERNKKVYDSLKTIKMLKKNYQPDSHLADLFLSHRGFWGQSTASGCGFWKPKSYGLFECINRGPEKSIVRSNVSAKK